MHSSGSPTPWQTSDSSGMSAQELAKLVAKFRDQFLQYMDRKDGTNKYPDSNSGDGRRDDLLDLERKESDPHTK